VEIITLLLEIWRCASTLLTLTLLLEVLLLEALVVMEVQEHQTQLQEQQHLTLAEEVVQLLLEDQQVVVVQVVVQQVQLVQVQEQQQHLVQLTQVAVEVDGPLHFSANVPYTPLGHTLLRNRLMRARGVELACVPYHRWNALQGAAARQEYLAGLLAGHGLVEY
jgi:hypothetical protein